MKDLVEEVPRELYPTHSESALIDFEIDYNHNHEFDEFCGRDGFSGNRKWRRWLILAPETEVAVILSRKLI